MNFINLENLNISNFELTDYCNAACPMCVRHDWDGNLRKNLVNKHHTSLEFIKQTIPTDILQQLKLIRSCGTYGDAIMNPECLDIYEYFCTLNNNRIELFTNGGVRNKDFWKNLAKLDIVVTFSIDGLQDTNHLYRRNVQWERLIENVTIYLQNGGKAIWEFLIFKHNEHQIEVARELSKKLGFKYFVPKHTGRWKDYNNEGEYRDTDKIAVDDYFIEKPDSQNDWSTIEKARPLEYFKDKEAKYKEIVCKSCNKNDVEIYIRANGLVSPCCWLGDTTVHEAKRLIEDYRAINLHFTSLEKILSGDFFTKLKDGIYNEKSKNRLTTCYSCCGVS